MNTVRPGEASTLIAIADAIEISDSHRQVAMYMWSDDRRTWLDVTDPVGPYERSGSTMYALVDLAQRAGCTIAAWKDRKRIT